MLRNESDGQTRLQRVRSTAEPHYQVAGNPTTTIVRSSAAAAVAGGGDGRDPGSRAPVVSVCVRIDAARVPHRDLFSPPVTTITSPAAAAAEIVVARFTRPTGKHGRGTHSGVLSGRPRFCSLSFFFSTPYRLASNVLGAHSENDRPTRAAPRVHDL